LLLVLGADDCEGALLVEGAALEVGAVDNVGAMLVLG